MVASLVSLLILVLVLGLVIGLIVWLIPMLGLPEPFGRFAIAICALIAIIILLVYALPLVHVA